MKKLLMILFCSFLVSSCVIYEKDPEQIKKAFNFEATNDYAVIYVLRDFPTKKFTSTAVTLSQIINPDDRNTFEDAMNSLDGESTKGAGISLYHYEFHEDSFVRLEIAPGKYNMYSYFVFASQQEIVQSRKIKEFISGNVYFFNVKPKPLGPYSSTIYFLNELTQKEAQYLIKGKNLPLLTSTEGIDGRKDNED